MISTIIIEGLHAANIMLHTYNSQRRMRGRRDRGSLSLIGNSCLLIRSNFRFLILANKTQKFGLHLDELICLKFSKIITIHFSNKNNASFEAESRGCMHYHVGGACNAEYNFLLSEGMVQQDGL